MRNGTGIDEFMAGVSGTMLILLTLSVLSVTGCADHGKYRVMLVASAGEYRTGMTWDQIREGAFNKRYTVRVSDATGHSVPLYRYSHDDGKIVPLDESEIHISTPIIIGRDYETVWLSVLKHGVEIAKVPVAIRDLKRLKGGPERYVIPVELPAGQAE